ncbi:MAG: BACON domain-containing protein [Bryobacteraceae bacterium]|nr:hypothetical protein [Bryobacterales bacterium]NUN02842.1 BACON domain-containing protein [Bryobacteraceae bacterium]
MFRRGFGSVVSLLLAIAAVEAQPPPGLQITSLTPGSVPAGSSGVSLQVDGTGFRGPSICLTVCGVACPRASVVQIDGSDLPTSFVSGTRLTASVPGVLLGVPRTASIRVHNRTDIVCETGGTSSFSNTRLFTVTTPPPNVTPSPSTVGMNAAAGSTNPVSFPVLLTNNGSLPVTFSVSTDAPFLSTSPGTGSIGVGQDINLAVIGNPTGLRAGIYTGSVTIRVQNAGGLGGQQQLISLPTTFDVQGTVLSFDPPGPLRLTAKVNEVAMANLRLRDVAGGTTVAVTARADIGAWLRITTLPASGEAPFLFTVAADAAGLPPGDYFGTVSGASIAGAPALEERLAVVFTVTPEVNLTVSPAEITCGIDSSVGIKPGDRTISVTSNTPVTSFSVIPISDGSWLDVDVKFGGVPAQLRVSCDAMRIASLPATGTLLITALSGLQKTVTVTAIARSRRRTIPQIADGGAFKTTITLVNADKVPATVSLVFRRSDGPDARTTQPWNIALANNQPIQDVTIQPGNVYTVETAALESFTSIGWAEVISEQNVTGFAVYRQRLPGQPDQEAAVPVNQGDMQRFLLPFDNRAGFRTTMAIANLSTTESAVVSVAFRDASGIPIGGGTVKTIPPQGHYAYRLIDDFPIDGQEGVAEFTAVSGQISAVGLRFNPTSSFTSFEVQRFASPVGAVRRVIPQIAEGGAYTTTITLVNTDTVPATVSLRFYRSDGPDVRTTQPWNPPIVGNRPTGNVILQPGNVYTVQTAGQGNLTFIGWAELVTNQAVSGFAVYRQRIPGVADQEATVPINTESMQSFLLPFDNRDFFRTTMAIANLSTTEQALVQVVFRDTNGAPLRTALVKTIPAQGHYAFRLIDDFGLDGVQGVAQFTALSGQISAVGLRFNPTNAFTSFKVQPN